MEFKKCPRCGNFFTSDIDVCQSCKTNEKIGRAHVRTPVTS